MDWDEDDILEGFQIPRLISTPSNNYYSNEEQKVMIIFKDIVSSLSFLGCCTMLILAVLFQRYRLFSERLVLYVTIAAAFNSLAYLITHPHGTSQSSVDMCVLEGFFITVTDWNLLIWVNCIVFNLYVNLIHEIPTNNWERWYIIISTIVPIPIALIPLIENKYGQAGPWCWIKNDFNWRIFMWFVPVTFAFFVMLVAFIFIIKAMHHQMTTWQGLHDCDALARREYFEKSVKPMLGYPFIYLLLNIFPLANRIYEKSNQEKSNFPLVLLHTISSPLVGIFYTVGFGFRRELRSQLSIEGFKQAWYNLRHRNRYPDYRVIERNIS